MRCIRNQRECNTCGRKNDSHVTHCEHCGTKLTFKRNSTLLLVGAVILILLPASSVAFIVLRPSSNHPTGATPTTGVAPTSSVTAVSRATPVNEENIGISDGSTTFYTSPDDLAPKQQAADDMKKSDVHDAIFSRDFLQAAYIAQKQCNDHTLHLIDANNTPLCPAGGKLLRLLIANSGSDPNKSVDVAQQIVQLAKADPTIVGVLGWTTSETTIKVLPILQQKQLPVVTASNAGDALSGQPGFFRTGSPISAQMPLIQQYISTQLNPQNMVIFDHNSDTYYSRELANSIHNQFPQSTEPIEYNAGDVQGTARLIKNADVVVMATNNVQDLVTLLKSDIPADANMNPHLKVFTGGTGYELVEAGQSHLPNYNRVVFCTPTFPDV
jgi:Periplasmic binding protein